MAANRETCHNYDKLTLGLNPKQTGPGVVEAHSIITGADNAKLWRQQKADLLQESLQVLRQLLSAAGEPRLTVQACK